MQVNVASLSDKDMRDIAEYFAVQKPPRMSFDLNPEKVTLGKERARELKCASCHRQDFSGGDNVPRLAGQVPGYITNQVNHFRSGKRAHGKETVEDGLRNLTEQDAEKPRALLRFDSVGSAISCTTATRGSRSQVNAVRSAANGSWRFVTAESSLGFIRPNEAALMIA
jgi:cytochrome c553